MELLLRKHIKNMHSNKSTTSKTKKMVKTNNNDDENEMLIDEGQELTDRLDEVESNALSTVQEKENEAKMIVQDSSYKKIY